MRQRRANAQVESMFMARISAEHSKLWAAIAETNALVAGSCADLIQAEQAASTDPHYAMSFNYTPCLHTWECNGSDLPHLCRFGRGHPIEHKCQCGASTPPSKP